MTMQKRGSRLTTIAILPVGTLLAFLLSLGISVPVVAQQQPSTWSYKSAKQSITDPREVRSLRQGVNEILRAGGGLSSEQEQTLKRYYGLTVFAAMTTPEAVADANKFPDWRFEIIRDLSILGGNTAAHNTLRQIVFDFAKTISGEGYHPACRYNAVLILGELNQTETRRVGLETVAAVPYAPARNLLLAFAAPDQAPEVQIAALIGLQRHAKLLAANRQGDANLIRVMVDTLRASQPAAGESTDGFLWKKRLAVETLGVVGQSDATALLDPVVKDQSLPLSLRSTAVRALGQLDYRNAQNVDSASILKGMGSVALTACRQEIDRIQAYLTENPPENTVIGDSVPVSPDATPVEDPVVLRARRSITYHLLCVRAGVRGIEAALTDPGQKNVATALRSEVEAILASLEKDPEKATLSDLVGKIAAPAARLERVVNSA